MVDLYICEPVSGGADTLPHGQPLRGSDHMWWEHVSAGHLMKIIFHCQENIWISIAEPAARASTQSRSLLIIFRVQESKSDRGKIFTFDILPRDDVTRPHTRGKIVITVWAISRESSGTEGHLPPSDWSLGRCKVLWLVRVMNTILTATNWAWNLLERNTTSHFLITSSFSHVVIAEKLISLWQNRETSPSASRQTITALVQFSKPSLSFSHK